uniref:Reverse transcriptase RNase H-like domain-containing protein n=1 Tax=Amphimedon queenslandica TaxID=400682 RepID=A0A1X7VS62_AMPQE
METSFICLSLTKSNRNEKEGLAITWSCEKFSPYILGKRILIKTDHKPFVSLFGVKDLDKLPAQILRFRLRLTRFNYSVPSNLPNTADTLSQAPQNLNTPDTRLIDEAELLIAVTVDNLPASKLKMYKGQQLKDPICSKVVHCCQSGWPSKQGIENHLKPYWEIRGELTLKDILFMCGNQMVVPKSLQKTTLNKIHKGH